MNEYFQRAKNFSSYLLKRNSNGDGSDAMNDPEMWTSDTEPFYCDQIFRSRRLRDEVIRKVLSDNAIVTMERLKKKWSSSPGHASPFIEAATSIQNILGRDVGWRILV